jgi:hypothetical protein
MGNIRKKEPCMHYLRLLMTLCICLMLPAIGLADEPSMPQIDGDWWQVADDPDLGDLTHPKQQPVDFGIWQAADGAWQIWSCIRSTREWGNRRLFHRWEGQRITDRDWVPMGISMRAQQVSHGEQSGGLQAPHVIRVNDVYYMFYGDWVRICLAKSEDGKEFRRVVDLDGQPDLFSGPWTNSRDAMVLFWNGVYYCYYTGHLGFRKAGADFCRTSVDLRNWSDPVTVAMGGEAGSGTWSAECPFVVYRDGYFYLFRTQRYGQNNQTTVYASRDPLDFGINDDRYRLGTLPVAAPEIVCHEGQWYIAALNRDLKGIRIAKLQWQPGR